MNKYFSDRGYCWHQIIQTHDASQDYPPIQDEKGFVFIGYCSDEGVQRNHGRPGAAQGPEMIRKILYNLPVYSNYDEHSFRLIDGGNILDTNRNVETTQLALMNAVRKILDAGYFPIVLGGGHDLAYGHFVSIVSHLQLKSKTPHIGIINFDAHFDLRPYTDTPSSGTPFLQIAERCRIMKLPFFYFCLGIQEPGNQKSLFQTAEQFKVDYIDAFDLHINNSRKINKRIENFIKKMYAVYLTIDLDVFAAPFAPGVSAPSFTGIYPDIFFKLLQKIIRSGKVISCDIAELNPRYDIDNRTSRLEGAIVYEIIKNVVNLEK